MPLAHTPYDGTATPFTIGLRPLDPGDWIEPGEDLADCLAEKDRLLASVRDVVWRETPESRPAQEETLALLADFLPARFPEIWQRDEDGLAVRPAGLRIPLEGAAMPPLERAARLVAEDLVLMRKAADGWRLDAAVLAFPSSWSLAEKFDRPMDDIHRSVPGFGPGSRNAELIARIFDRLLVDQPVWRLNWSIYPDGRRHHPKSKHDDGSNLAPATGAAGSFIRVERQTLRKLPRSGAILFTIRIYADPLAAIAAHPDSRRLAASLKAQLGAMTSPQLAYKSLIEKRDGLIEALVAIAGD